jgi:hypothetical protein
MRIRYPAALIVAAATLPLAVPAGATVSPSGPQPAAGTPQIPLSPFANIAALAACGGRIYAGGTFSRILTHGKTVTRRGLFSFAASPPFTVTGWNPDVAGTVAALTFAGGCSKIIAGGTFHAIHGTTVHNIAAISTSTGLVDRGFAASASAPVATLADWHGHLTVGGAFKSINGHPASGYTSLSPVTGRYDGWVNFGTGGGSVSAQAVSHSGAALVLSGGFKTVGGKARPQAAMLRAGRSHPAVTGWTTPAFGATCKRDEKWWARGLAWSGDDSTVYVAATGLRTFPHRLPLTGLCDTLSALPATGSAVRPRWVNYTGCDSLYSAVEAGGVVFTAGHQRWAHNQRACNKRGPGAQPDPGLWGASPATGQILTVGGRPRYFMSKANGDAFTVTAGRVWVGSSNRQGSRMCLGKLGHAGLCAFPVP